MSILPPGTSKGIGGITDRSEDISKFLQRNQSNGTKTGCSNLIGYQLLKAYARGAVSDKIKGPT